MGDRQAPPCRGRSLVLQFFHMSHTITVRLTKTLAVWLEEMAAQTGVSQGQIIREQLEKLLA